VVVLPEAPLELFPGVPAVFDREALLGEIRRVSGAA
jgi:hypothetical protein